ncbi:MAG: N-acetylmuramoyl-L-alanine amidase family protein [Acutalibacteraceae bacterium]
MAEHNYDSRLAQLERRRRKRRKIILRRIICFLLLLGVTAGAVFGGVMIYKTVKGGGSSPAKLEKVKAIEIPDWIDEQIIHLHNTARTGTGLDGVKNLVIHYVGNPNTTAQNNRDYFDKDSTEVSSHFVVGLEGEIIQCVPLWEKSAASNWRNSDTISIEVCHPDDTGRFNDDTYNAVIKLASWLLNELGLDESAVIRHYDITGKLCPLYYVEHEDAWNQMKKDIGTKLNEYSK